MMSGLCRDIGNTVIPLGMGGIPSQAGEWIRLTAEAECPLNVGQRCAFARPTQLHMGIGIGIVGARRAVPLLITQHAFDTIRR